MSTRQLRRLQQQKELQKVDAAATIEDDSENDIGVSTSAPTHRVNLFAALGDGGEDNDQNVDEDDDDSHASFGDAHPTLSEPASVGNASDPTTSRKQTKKKKKKKKKAASTVAKNAVSNYAVEMEQGGGEDEIDKAIMELNIDTQRLKVKDMPAQGAPDEDTLRLNRLLSIDPTRLRAINEMKSLFGREVMESADAEERQDSRRRGRRSVRETVDLETFLREPPGAKKLSDVSLRRNAFAQGRDHWPRQPAGGLTMKEMAKAPDGSWVEYAYHHDREYDQTQIMFFTCVQTGDPMRMVHLLKRVPYHVSTLLQVSNVAKQDQNMALAAELCERALFTLGRVATSSFRQAMEQGRARLDFRRPENRQFWLAGYHHLQSLIRKGTYRTALEWAKLLYAVDPRDPYSMRHYIHALAIRAHEGHWLIDFLDELSRNRQVGDVVYPRQSLVLAKLQTGDVEGARQCLTQGMRRLPWLYCALFQELKLDAPPSIWGMKAESETRIFWVSLYIALTKDLWNNSQAMALLRDVATGLGGRLETASFEGEDLPVDLGATRMAYLGSMTELLAVAPRKYLQSQPNYDFDPLPPREEENIFTSEGTKLPWHTLQAEARRREMLAQMLGMPARQQEVAAAFDAGVEEEDDEEMRALWAADDEELRRDLEAHASRANARGGLLATLMGLLGVNGGRGTEANERGDRPEAADEDNPGTSDMEGDDGVSDGEAGTAG